MDAVALLKEHIDPVSIMEHYDFDKITNEGNMVRSCCKIHGGRNPTSFVMNPETGLWYCHTGECGGGDIYTLVRKLKGCSFREAVQEVADISGIDISNMEVVSKKEEHVKELSTWFKRMKEWNKRDEALAYSFDEEVKEVTKFRDFSEETLSHFGVFYVEKIKLDKSDGQHYHLYKRLGVPIIQDGVQVGISLRKTRENDFPKWSHQPISIRVANLLYNYDSIINGEPIVVVEGAFDVWAFHEIGINAVATYGANISDEQYRMLMRTGSDLVFAFDGDEAGLGATNKAIERFRNKANCYCIDFEQNQDPASISREELKIKYESRRRIC
jgi:DNA primase